MNAFGVQSLAAGNSKQRTDDITANLGSIRNTGDPEMISAAGDFYVEAAFDLSQMLIELSTKISETAIVGRFQDEFPGYLYGVQGLAVRPLSKVTLAAFALIIRLCKTTSIPVELE